MLLISHSLHAAYRRAKQIKLAQADTADMLGKSRTTPEDAMKAYRVAAAKAGPTVEDKLQRLLAKKRVRDSILNG